MVNLPDGSVKSFVLDNDPIPRAMLSVDPTFALLKQSAPLSFLLETRKRLFGSGASFTPERFLYENVGDVSDHAACCWPVISHLNCMLNCLSYTSPDT